MTQQLQSQRQPQSQPDTMRRQHIKLSRSKQITIHLRHHHYSDGKYVDVGGMNIWCRSCNAFNFNAENIMSSLVCTPQFTECCGNRMVILPLFEGLPPLFRRLLTAPDRVSTAFRSNVHAYNSSLAVCCIKADWVCRGHGTLLSIQLWTFMDGYITIWVLWYLFQICNHPAYSFKFTTLNMCHKKNRMLLKCHI